MTKTSAQALKDLKKIKKKKNDGADLKKQTDSTD